MRAGNVPTAQVGPIIEQLIAERWPESRRQMHEPAGIQILAEKVGCHPDAIEGIIAQHNPGAGFDLVDKLLCALGRPDLWWGVLSDVYWDVDLRQVPGIKHGTKHSYQWYRCRCDDCRRANRDSIRAHRSTPSRATWRKCVRCDAKYTPRQTGQNYCSRKCSKLDSSQRWREANREQKREIDRAYQRRRKAAVAA